MPKFIRIQNRVINLDAISYVDFLESGRAMMFMHGLTQEKQNISLDPVEARRLRDFMEEECMHEAYSLARHMPR
jgi:hypothetical protein